MADINALLADAAGEEVVPPRETPAVALAETALGKRNAVRMAAAEKIRTMPAPVPAPQLSEADSYRAAAGEATGAGRASMTPLERELATLTPNQIQEKYGFDEGNRLIRQQLAGIKDFSSDSKGYRTAENMASDAVSGIGLGLANAVGGIGALGAGLVNDQAGVSITKGLQSLNQTVQGTQSPTLQNNRKAVGVVNSLDFRDSTAQFEKDKEKDGNLVASLARIGRDTVSSIKNTASDPATLSDGIAQGFGSLVAAGPLGKVVGAAGKALAPAADAAGRVGLGVAAGLDAAGASTASRLLMAAGERLPGALPSSTAVGIGAMEAGGAYQGTASDIAGMTPAQLEANSPYYREMRAQGLSHEQAQAKAANRAGLVAGAIAGPAGVLAGGLVSKFEGAPLRVPNIRAGAMNLGRETVEEGLQGATGQLAQNIGTQAYGDQSRSLSDGVGEQIGTGALFGLGSAGVVQAPGMAGQASALLARAAGNAVVGAVNDRADSIRAKNDAASPVADAKVQAAGAEVQQAASETAATMADAVQQAASAPGSTPEQHAAMQALADKIIGASNFDPTQYEDARLPGTVKEALLGSTNRVQAVQQLARLVHKADPDSAEGLIGAVKLHELLNQYEDVVHSDPAALEAIPEDHPANQVIETFNTLAAKLQQSPAVQQALARVPALLAQAQAKFEKTSITEASLDTPEGQQAAETAIGVAQLDPSKGDIKTNEVILAHASAGKLNLTDTQRSALLTSNAILKAAQKASEEQKALGHKRLLDDVSDEIQVNKDPDAPKMSAVAHAIGIQKAMRAGNVEQAKSLLESFGKFVQHMANKAEAFNTHFAEGPGKNAPYQALNPRTGKWYEDKAGVGIHPDKANSVELAQRVQLEAQRLADIYNGLSEAFPSLKGGKREVIQLDPKLQGKPEEVAQAFKSGERVRTPGSKPQAKTETKTETKTEEVKPAEKKEAAAATETASAPVAQEPATKAAAEKEDTKDEKTETKEEAPAPVLQGMDAAYPKLAGAEPGSKITNWFKKAFKLPKEQKSNIIGEESPLQSVIDAVDQAEEGDTAKAYRVYLRTGKALAKILDARLQAYLSNTPKTGASAGKTLISRFLGGTLDANSLVDGKVLNLTEQDGDKLSYNQELSEGAILAGLQWVLSAEQRETVMDEQAVAGLTGIPADMVDDSLISLLSQNGLPTVTAVRTLAQKIQSFWGLDVDGSAPDGYAQGISEAMAKEIIEALIENGDLVKTTVDIPEEYGLPEAKTLNFFKSSKPLTGDHPMAKAPSAIEKMVLTQPEDVLFFGDNLPKVAPTQLRNPAVANTAEQKKMIRSEQATSHYVNIPMVKLYQALGLPNISRLFGAGELKDRELNKNHAASLDGSNRTIAAAFNHLMVTVAEITSEADKANDGKGVPVDQLPIHYAYNVNRVGRLQMLGRYNPQSTKLVREAILPTRSTLDLSDENGRDYQKFMLAVAQAVGVKVHKEMPDVALAKTEKLLTGDLAQAVEMLREFHATGKVDESLVDELKTHLKGDLTVVALHALSEYARLQETTVKTGFTTPLYVEADGVTNGPVMAMMLLTAGRFTPHWVKNMAKGGLFFRGPKTMNEQHSAHDGNDLYQETTFKLSDAFREMASSIESPEVQGQLNQLKSMMDLFMPDFKVMDDGKVEMKRGIAKNPLTITIYGSGEKGIASKVVSAMTEQLYERMSEVAEKRKANPEMSMAEAMFGRESTDLASAEAKLAKFAAAYKALTTNVVAKRKGKLELTQGEKVDAPKGFDPKTFTIDKARLANLTDNVRHLFVTPLRAAITETIGQPLMDSAKLLQQATQIQSLFQQHAFNSAVEAAIAEKAKTNPRAKQEGLSRIERDAILKDVLAKFPLVTTDRQSFFIAGSQSTDVNSTEWSKSLTSHFGTPGFVYGPTDSGVAGIPMMVIGTGDGQMMQTLATMKGAPTQSLKIFDGVNFPLDKLEDSSTKANQAVFDAWQGNPMQAVADSFSASLPNFDLDGLPETMIAGMKKTLSTKEKPIKTDEQLMDALNALAQTMQKDALYIEARHRAIARVSHSIDQMAAAAAPYQHEGIELQGTTDEAIAGELNKLAREELALIQEERKNTPLLDNKVEPVAPNKINLLNKKFVYGTVDPKSGARVLTYTSLNRLMKQLGLPPTMQAIFDQIRLAKAAKGYKIVHGTVEQMQAYASSKGQSEQVLSQLADTNTHGFVSVGDQTIYLIDPSAETVVHELIHAATFQTVQAVLDGSETDPEMVQAVGRLLTLQDQFLALDEADPSYLDAVDAIKGHQAQGNAAAALNEFMAWGLANKDLAETLGKAKVSSPLVQLAKDVFKAIKALIFGRAKVSQPGEDMLSNLLFNTSLLVRAQPTLQARARDGLLMMSRRHGSSDRLAEINAAFDKSIISWVNSNPKDKVGTQDRLDKHDIANLQASELANSVVNHGFPMTGQALFTFKSMVAALATEAAIDPTSMAMAQTLYTHVEKHLTVESLMQGNPPEGTLEWDIARHYAQERYDVLVGRYLVQKDTKGRSSLLPVFLALATVDDTLRGALAKIDLPKTVLQKWNTLDGVLENAGNIAIDKLSERMSGIEKTQDVKQAIDALSRRIQDVVQENETLLDQLASQAGGLVDRANQIFTEGVSALAGKAAKAAGDLHARKGTKLTKGLAATTSVLSAIVNETDADKVAQGVTSYINTIKGFAPIRELIGDLIGRTESNKNVYDLIKLFKADVSQDRQQFREHLPTKIAAAFSRKLNDAEWTTLFQGMGKTDLAALELHMKKSDILDLIADPKKLNQAIDTLESYLQDQDKPHWNLLQRKAKQLATYMNTGTAGTNLLRNAEAVANLLGERTQQKRANPSKLYVNAVDQLVTLYALKAIPSPTKSVLASLVQTERKGMEFTLAYLVGQRSEEVSKSDTPRAKFNAYKGYVPSLNKEGVSLVVADDRNFSDLLEKSYQRVANYEGSAADGTSGSRGYYFAPVGARSPFNQGIAQNVKQTASGVEASTGFTEGLTAGRIADPASVEQIQKRLHLEKPGAKESLLPVYDETGKVVAFERSVDPVQLARLQQDTHLAKMIGVWRGRQVEEAKANIFNRRLVDRLHDMHKEDMQASSANKSRYVNLFDTKSLDPIARDAVSLMSHDILEYAKSVFGEEGFYVRRDMLNDAIGYRNASVGDAWTGNSRWSAGTQNQVRSMALAAFGNDAYRYVMNREKDIQNIVKDVRQLVLVKSMVVPMANFVSNIYQMISRGVPMAHITRALPKKLAEINAYTKSRLREIEAEAELRAAKGDVVTERRLKVEIQTIRDSHRRMSIWPLIVAGEFTAISDVGISRDELLLSEGKLHAYMERLASKLPEGLRTAGRYALVTKDTALFQGLQKAVEYGDFLGKAIIYDDLVGRQKKSQKEALGRVSEEFVNYDRLPGRFRGYLESMGLLWFYHFKIRSVKIALSMIRNNPVHALLGAALPTPISSVGTPLGDNLFTKGLEGTLGYSIGPGMAIGSYRLNPWVNLVN